MPMSLSIDLLDEQTVKLSVPLAKLVSAGLIITNLDILLVKLARAMRTSEDNTQRHSTLSISPLARFSYPSSYLTRLSTSHLSSLLTYLLT